MAKILIIEDDPLVSRMHQKIFAFEKFDVDTASNGEEGLEKAKSGNPSLILLDLMLPKMSGLEVLDQLKAEPKTKKIPVVILTNLSDQHETDLASAKGAVKIIHKSESDPKQIVEIIRKILQENGHSGISGQEK
ncbi:MAG: hypothetical protein A2900_01830 [Candidatus Chisholmbacteria bacterium RIFCSPLOWO2_01_FULL_50_28]|uniref:Response regulatory domain-containing protein n=1 Tax=Candidatus Chisholmbacteria bacterium RIFCSPHIGHO2_01_FULL_52_32 TaxID=1797591 RepID=A0A1G1VUC3_9BACT|nr:MAG: hypothetical protein A2786_04915 [Candidatus Chisholmbacteria bacterium RIFCSPHIGHO2_01_FULL_52_32]OGY19823.1 MAG: hypothetical protein A2900_01830 [Candidatus Chisholmbacteria bacterium RIFCSPLOWO2_01_FULL_50_28]